MAGWSLGVGTHSLQSWIGMVALLKSKRSALHRRVGTPAVVSEWRLLKGTLFLGQDSVESWFMPSFIISSSRYVHIHGNFAEQAGIVSLV